MKWPMVKLDNIVTIKGGGTPSKKEESYWNGDIPWASVKDLKSSVITQTEDSITMLGVKNSATNIIPAGTIITATRMALGKFAINAIDIAINQDLKALFINDNQKTDKNYLIRFLESKSQYIDNEGKGATVKGVTLDFLKEIEIPLPPLAEQKRIAAILDKADAIRRKRQQAIQLADDFLRSVFLDMFGDPVTNPKGWEVKKLNEGILSIVSGWSVSGESYPCGNNEKGVLKISAVTTGKFISEENKFVHSDKILENKVLVHPMRGDLLFSRANTRELVAASCIVDRDYQHLFLPDKLWKVQTKPQLLLPDFLNQLLWHPKFKETLTSQATGTSGSMLNISKSKFENSVAIYPPIELQQKFKAIKDKVTHSLSLIEQAAEKPLFEALSQRAFAGEL